MSKSSGETTAVITGMGCLCAAGHCPDAVLDAMEGTPARVPSSFLGEHALPFPFLAAHDPDHESLGAGDGPLFPGGRRFSALDTLFLAQRAAALALREAALPPEARAAMAIFMGTTAGSALHFLHDYAMTRGKETTFTPPIPPARLREPGLTQKLSDKADYLASNLALALVPESRGPRLTLTNACTSGADAVGMGLAAIQQGASCVLCGGADALSLVPHSGFARLMIYSDEPCRPFDRHRKGLNLGEGAAVLVLESETSALRRKAPILGRVIGYGAAADAHHFTAPHPQARGLTRAMRQALQQAACGPEDLAFINAHATATPENDKVEGQALRDFAPGVPVWASKGVTGHTLGAAGALEAVLTVQALRRGVTPPSPGFLTEDPAIGFSPTLRRLTLAVGADKALSTSLGFGGGNAALLLQGERL